MLLLHQYKPKLCPVRQRDQLIRNGMRPEFNKSPVCAGNSKSAYEFRPEHRTWRLVRYAVVTDK